MLIKENKDKLDTELRPVNIEEELEIVINYLDSYKVYIIIYYKALHSIVSPDFLTKEKL